MDINKLKILHYINKRHNNGLTVDELKSYSSKVKISKSDYNEILFEFEKLNLIKYSNSKNKIFSTYKGLHYIRNKVIKFLIFNFLFPLLVAYITALFTINNKDCSDICCNSRNNTSYQKAK